jgi:hypothetical protein
MAHTSGLHSSLFAAQLIAKNHFRQQSGFVFSLALIARGAKMNIHTNQTTGYKMAYGSTVRCWIHKSVAIMGNDVSISAIATKSPCETTFKFVVLFFYHYSFFYSLFNKHLLPSSLLVSV